MRERGKEGGGIQSRDQFSDGGYLEEPVATSFLPCVWNLIGGEFLRQHDRLAGSGRHDCGLAADAVIHQIPCRAPRAVYSSIFQYVPV